MASYKGFEIFGDLENVGGDDLTRVYRAYRLALNDYTLEPELEYVEGTAADTEAVCISQLDDCWRDFFRKWGISRPV